MSLKLSSETIKAEARNLGFFACGIAKAEPVEAEEAARFAAWLGRKGHAGMDYMAANVDKRLNPQLLMPGVKSIVCVALSYAPSSRIPADEPQLAAYALGQDYHYIMKDKLRKLASTLGLTERTDNNNTLAATLPKVDKPCSANAASQSSLGSGPNNLPVHNQKSNQNFQFSILNSQIPTFRAFCDTAPVLERYWAMKAGLGWIGRNHQLIIPHAGSMFFLGELFVDAELEYDTPLPSRCGNCHACTDACPTGALHLTDDSRRTEFSSDRCLSYLTIESRGDIPQEYGLQDGQLHLRLRSLPGRLSMEQVCTGHNRRAAPPVRRTAQHDAREMDITDRGRLSPALQRQRREACQIRRTDAQHQGCAERQRQQ